MLDARLRGHDIGAGMMIRTYGWRWVEIGTTRAAGPCAALRLLAMAVLVSRLCENLSRRLRLGLLFAG